MSDRPTPETDVAEAKRRAEWLHKHKAHKDWIILSVPEVTVIRDELLKLERERDEAREALARISEAAVAVLDRWEQPAWKDTEPTAAVFYRLRDALGRGEK